MKKIQVDPKRLAVVASLVIFFSWSVDNLLKKSIDGTVAAISSAEEAWVEADRYQELARDQQEIFTGIKGLFMEFVRVHEDKYGIAKISLREAMETELVAETTRDFINRHARTASVLIRAFDGVSLSREVREAMYLHADDLWKRAKIADDAAMRFRKESLELLPLETDFEMKDVTEEQAMAAQKIASQYSDEIGKALIGIEIPALELRKSTDAALNELNSKKATLGKLSKFISWFQLSLFVIGSLLAIFVKFRSSTDSN